MTRRKIAPVIFRKKQINADLLFCFSDEKQPWSTPAVALIHAGILLTVLLISEVAAAGGDNESLSIGTHGTVWYGRIGTQSQRVSRSP